MSFPSSSHALSPQEEAASSKREGFKSSRMLTALAFLVIIVILCVGVAFLDRKMVLAMSFDSTPSNTLILRQRIPESGSLLAQKLAFPVDVLNGTEDKSTSSLQQTDPVRRPPRIQTTNNQTYNKSSTTTTIPAIPDAYASTIPTKPEPRVSKFYDPPPFRLIQDDVSGTFDNNRWEVNHIVRNDSLRKKLEIVDGLRNQEVAVFITSTWVKHGIYHRDRIIPSSRTWMRQLYNIYVILEDTFELRHSFRHCKRQEAYNTTHTYFICPNEEPIYLLTRKCTSQYYQADSACCKVDEAINFITHSQHKVYSRLQYFVHADDDTYFRVDQLLRWLAAVKKARVEHLPIVAGGEVTHYLFQKNPTGGIYGWEGCKEIKAAGWYQPFVLNKAALEVLKVATKNYGATQICKAYKISQDAGLGLLFWMYSLYHIYFPLMQTNSRHLGIQAFTPKLIAVHAIRHAMHGFPNEPNEDCYGDNVTAWGNLRYDQEIAEGCGKIGQDAPAHNPLATASMYDAWDHYFLRNKGINATVGVVGVNEFVNAIIGEDGLVTIPTSVPSPILIELNDINSTIQQYSGIRNPSGTGIYWSIPKELTAAMSKAVGGGTGKDFAGENIDKNNNNNDSSSSSSSSNTKVSLPLPRQKTSAAVDSSASESNNEKKNSDKDKSSTDKTSNEKTSSDKTSTDKTNSEKSSNEKTSNEKTSSDKTSNKESNSDKTSSDKNNKSRLRHRRLSSLVSSRDSESDRKRQVDHHLTPPTYLDFNESTYRLPPDTVIVIPLIARLTGYEQTQHAKDYDIKKVFTPFLPSHCSPPGTTTMKRAKR